MVRRSLAREARPTGKRPAPAESAEPSGETSKGPGPYAAAPTAGPCAAPSAGPYALPSAGSSGARKKEGGMLGRCTFVCAGIAAWHCSLKM